MVSVSPSPFVSRACQRATVLGIHKPGHLVVLKVRKNKWLLLSSGFDQDLNHKWRPNLTHSHQRGRNVDKLRSIWRTDLPPPPNFISQWRRSVIHCRSSPKLQSSLFLLIDFIVDQLVGLSELCVSRWQRPFLLFLPVLYIFFIYCWADGGSGAWGRCTGCACCLVTLAGLRVVFVVSHGRVLVQTDPFGNGSVFKEVV